MLCSIFVCLINKTNADNRIVIHLRHLPDQERQKIIKKYKQSPGIKKLKSFNKKTPGEVSKKLFKSGIRKYLTH